MIQREKRKRERERERGSCRLLIKDIYGNFNLINDHGMLCDIMHALHKIFSTINVIQYNTMCVCLLSTHVTPLLEKQHFMLRACYDSALWKFPKFLFN